MMKRAIFVYMQEPFRWSKRNESFMDEEVSRRSALFYLFLLRSIFSIFGLSEEGGKSGSSGEHGCFTARDGLLDLLLGLSIRLTLQDI